MFLVIFGSCRQFLKNPELMKKLIYLFLVLTFVSCGKENYYEEFYGNGNIKLKIEINENKIRNGSEFSFTDT